MKIILSLLVLMSAVSAHAFDEELRDQKALSAARALYTMNITNSGNATFTITKRTCGGEDGTETCVFKITVKEKDASAGVTSYEATFMNEQLQKLEQSCKYCW